MPRRASAFIAATGLACWAGSSFAHGLLLKLDATADVVTGTAYFTNGAVAADEWVEWTDLDAPVEAPPAATPPATPTGQRTDASGGFHFTGVVGHRYRVRAYAEEGHQVELELRLGEARSPRLVDEGGEAINPWWPPPAWLVIGGVLLASIPFARFARRRAD